MAFTEFPIVTADSALTGAQGVAAIQKAHDMPSAEVVNESVSKSRIYPRLSQQYRANFINFGTTRTIMNSIMMPVSFSSVRVGVIHSGGNGAMTDASLLIGSSDEIGDLSYANTSAAKKFVTPMKDGVEYGGVSVNGWKRVTFEGVSTVSLPDAGADKISVAWSDWIDCASLEIANPPNPALAGRHPLLIRMWAGTGSLTLTGQGDGQLLPQYFTDVGGDVVLNARYLGDQVTDPTGWDQSKAGDFTDRNLAVAVEVLTSDKSRSVMVIGDSRFGTAPTEDSAALYRTTEQRIQKYLTESGIKATIVAASHGGRNTEKYFDRAIELLRSGNAHPSDAVYLVYSINNGLPTSEIISDCKAKALRFIDECVELAISPVLVTSFPTGGGYTSEELALLLDLDLFASNTRVKSFSPLSVYGDSNGDWVGGVNEDSNHMTSDGYDDLAGRLKDKILE
jgi:hypothetical protein